MARESQGHADTGKSVNDDDEANVWIFIEGQNV